MSPKVLALQADLSAHLDRIAGHFKRGVKLTLVVRNPDHGPEAGLVIGNDDLNLAAEEIRRRQAEEAAEPLPKLDTSQQRLDGTHV